MSIDLLAAPRADQSPARTRVPMVRALHATVRGSRGPAFRDVSFASSSSLLVIRGPQGSGRTSLALAIAGRMRLTHGRILTLGRDVSKRGRAVRRLTGIAGFRGIDELEPAVRVADLLAERISWAQPWYRRTPRLDDAALAARLAPTFGRAPIPPARTLARSLDPTQALLMRIALALVERPRLLVVDNVDQVLDPDQRARVIDSLARLHAGGLGLVLTAADTRGLAAIASSSDVVRMREARRPARTERRANAEGAR